MTATPEPPKTSTMLWRGLTKACPACGKRKLFRRLTMAETCPRCGLRFERIEGHWIGAIGINTIVCFGALLITIIVGLIATRPDFAVVPLMITAVVVSIVVPMLFYPISKTLWTAIDISMRPLEPHEVDWNRLTPGEPTAAESDRTPERDQ